MYMHVNFATWIGNVTAMHHPWMTLAMAATLVITLAACGGKGSDNVAGEEPVGVATAPTGPPVTASNPSSAAAGSSQSEAAAEAARMILAAAQAQRGGALCALMTEAAVDELSSIGPGTHDVAALCRDDPSDLFDVDRPHKTVLARLVSMLPFLYDGDRGINEDSEPQSIEKVQRLLADLPTIVQPLEPPGTLLVAFGYNPVTGLVVVDDDGWKLATFTAPPETQNVLADVKRLSNGLESCLRQRLGADLEAIEFPKSGGMELVLDEADPNEASPRARIYLFDSEQEVQARVAEGTLKSKIRIFGFAGHAGAVVYTTWPAETRSYVKPDPEDLTLPPIVRPAVEACAEELKLGDSRQRRINLGE